MAQHFLAGVGRALIFSGNDLIGVAKTLTDSTFDFSITGEEIRGGQGNALWGKYFHDSNLSVTLTDAMFNIQYIAASLGVNVQSGGLSVQEEELTATAAQNVTLSQTPVAFDGTMIGWYKKPTDSIWSIGTVSSSPTNTMSIPGSTQNEVYCVKYFYINENSKSIVIKTQYVPSELHVVIMNDLFSGDIGTQSNTTRYGRLITDIPRLQMDGNQNLALTATGAATVSLTGSALAVSTADTCEEDPYYGTMTEEVYGATWQNDVIALAVENSDIEMSSNDTTTLVVRAVFGGNMASLQKDNSNFTFTVENPPEPATGVTVGQNTGIVTTTSASSGNAIISVTLTGYQNVPPAYAFISVTGD